MRLFHVSESPLIEIFEPRPSPSHYEQIKTDVVFAVSEKMLHNYLLPRDCPRVSFYKGLNTTDKDAEIFLGSTTAEYVIVIESGWFNKVNECVLYCYELPADTFTLLDECAGYYVSEKAVVPLKSSRIGNVFEELLKRNVELRFAPTLQQIANTISSSSLNFSLIRMRNAVGQKMI